MATYWIINEFLASLISLFGSHDRNQQIEQQEKKSK